MAISTAGPVNPGPKLAAKVRPGRLELSGEIIPHRWLKGKWKLPREEPRHNWGGPGD